MGITTDVEKILPPPFEWCYIPRGIVTLADASKNHVRGAKGGNFYVMPFFMAKYPITNAQYQKFIDAKDGWRDDRWWGYSIKALADREHNPQPRMPSFEGKDLPRADINWFQAVAFCLWLSHQTELNITLPTEQEWQRAAQGDDNRKFPWGNEIDPNHSNYLNNVGRLTPVTRYPLGVSPYGVMDMGGNAAEWCLTASGSGENAIEANVEDRAVRGGSWNDMTIAARVFDRRYDFPEKWWWWHGSKGFRIVMIA